MRPATRTATKLLLGLFALLLVISVFVYKEWKRSENLKRLNDYAAAHPPTAEQAAALNRKAREKAKMQNLLNKLVDEDPDKCWDPLELSKLPKQPPYYYVSAETTGRSIFASTKRQRF